MSDIKLYAAVYLLLIRDRKVLLLRRFNTGWQDGMYTLPAGPIEPHETATMALVRETKEETGLDIDAAAVCFVHTQHRFTGERFYIDFFGVVDGVPGQPVNTEPHKCDDLSWFPLDAIPDSTLPYIKRVLQLHQDGVTFSEFGWD